MIQQIMNIIIEAGEFDCSFDCLLFLVCLQSTCKNRTGDFYVATGDRGNVPDFPGRPHFVLQHVWAFQSELLKTMRLTLET